MDLSVETALHGLSDGLDKGLFVENLHELIEFSKQVVTQASGPIRVAAYVVESVLADLDGFWDDVPVSSERYVEVNAQLGPALKRAVQAMIRPDERPLLQDQLEGLVGGFIALQRTQAIR